VFFSEKFLKKTQGPAKEHRAQPGRALERRPNDKREPGIVPRMTRTRWDAVREGIVKLPVNETLGFAIDHTGDGVAFDWTVPPEYCHAEGNLQGGMLAAFADAVLGGVAATELPEDHYPLLAEMKISILRPAPAGAKLRATGRVVKAGRRVVFTEAEITNTDTGKLVAKASGTGLSAKA
jgi:uncharacterized protein (TIGR00369 family)